MLFFKRREKLTIAEMILMEEELKNSELHSLNPQMGIEKLASELQLKIEYVSNLEEDNEAELLPPDDEEHLGLIRLRKDSEKDKFACIHEIMHFIFDVGYGNKVTKRYARRKKGTPISAEEQKINYKTAAYIMPQEEIMDALHTYDTTRPRMDEIKFVRDLQSRYGQSETAVIRRIREVRRLTKAGYC